MNAGGFHGQSMKEPRDNEGRKLAWTGLRLRAGKFYRNGHGDLRGPMRLVAGDTFLDEYGGVYRANGHQYSHHIESAGNLKTEESIQMADKIASIWDVVVAELQRLETLGKDDHRDSWMGNAIKAVNRLEEHCIANNAYVEHSGMTGEMLRQYVSDEDKRDAERYRWMRENDWDSPIIRLDYDDYENAKGEKLDTAVDAARGISPNEEKA